MVRIHQKSQICPVSLGHNAAEMRKINSRLPKSNLFSRWSGYINMSNFRPFKVTAIKKRINFIFDVTTKTKWKGKLEKKRRLPKIQNCNYAKSGRYVFLNHVEVSSQKIKSCCNNNLDEASTFNFSHYMDTRQSEMCNIKKLPKFRNFSRNSKHDTPSEVCWWDV